MEHWDYTQKYRCCIYLKIRAVGHPSKTYSTSVQLYAVCHREEEGWGAGWVWQRWLDSPLQQCCGTILTCMALSHLQLKDLCSMGPAALSVGPGATPAAGLSDLVLWKSSGKEGRTAQNIFLLTLFYAHSYWKSHRAWAAQTEGM